MVACLTATSVDAAPNRCAVDQEHIGAHYRVVESTSRQDASAPEVQADFYLWRRGNEVAHENRTKNVTEIWNVLANGMVRPVRYFDDYQRAIEYQPGEVNRGRGDRDWKSKFQLVSQARLGNMRLLSVSGEGCGQLEFYGYERGATKTLLTWMPAYQLVSRYESVGPRESSRWVLASVVTDTAIVDTRFNRWATYQTTDYADIGDNESDPFLRKMINLGFVDHGNSGFYNAHGEPVEAAQRH